MKRFIVALFVLAVLSGCCDCTNKVQVDFKDGTTKTVFGLERDNGNITYYESEDSYKKKEGKITISSADVTSTKEIPETEK